MDRELQYLAPGATAPRPIRVSISIPVQNVTTAGGTDWSCVLTIDGFPEAYSTPFCGVDAIQAMIFAMSTAPTAVESLTRSAGGGRVTFLGDENLGFPTFPAMHCADMDGENPAKQ